MTAPVQLVSVKNSKSHEGDALVYESNSDYVKPKGVFPMKDAQSELFKIKNSIIEIHNYTIDVKNDIGKGAYGIVYIGKNEINQTVAVKKIDGKQHPGILNQKLSKLLKLNHPNIVSIFDIHKHEEKFWMFMQLCSHGDLAKFCAQRQLKFKDKLEIMCGIAKGVSYLHENNIIHRDIKPPNILIANESPVETKLTDFDLSKCLDPEIETSVMSSNVGTLAFKAPEFFNRIDGKIQYHRNVDIYASGLTFLALLQAISATRKLVPRIETPLHNSELHAPSIGQLIAERIKYQVKELNIVIYDTLIGETQETEIKKLIKKMTCVNPKQRLSATEVVRTLKEVTAFIGLFLLDGLMFNYIT